MIPTIDDKETVEVMVYHFKNSDLSETKLTTT